MIQSTICHQSIGRMAKKKGEGKRKVHKIETFIEIDPLIPNHQTKFHAKILKIQ